MITFKVKPRQTGAKVMKPDGTLLKPNGEEVEKTIYWVRRLRDGDVVEIDAKGEPKKQGGK